MFRFLFACVFYTTIARWGYAELSMMLPSVAPYVKESIEAVEIPTHEHWSREGINDFFDRAGNFVEEASDVIDEFRGNLRK